MRTNVYQIRKFKKISRSKSCVTTIQDFCKNIIKEVILLSKSAYRAIVPISFFTNQYISLIIDTYVNMNFCDDEKSAKF